MIRHPLSTLTDALRRDGLLIGSVSSNPELTGVTADSRAVQPGMLYVAVRGASVDGIASWQTRFAGVRPPSPRNCPWSAGWWNCSSGTGAAPR